MDPFTYPPAAPPTVTRRRFTIQLNREFEAVCIISGYLFVCTCAILTRDYIVDHGQLTPASVSTLNAVLLYVLGIGFGLVASRLWVLIKDTFSVPDEEAQSHLARRSL